MKVRVKFETYEGEEVETEEEVIFPKWEKEKAKDGEEKWGSDGGEGVRKAVLLARYVEFMKRFLEDVGQRREEPTVTLKSGFLLLLTYFS